VLLVCPTGSDLHGLHTLIAMRWTPRLYLHQIYTYSFNSSPLSTACKESDILGVVMTSGVKSLTHDAFHSRNVVMLVLFTQSTHIESVLYRSGCG
jgi:hypothetical protein